ncbi:PDZ domain-containing protein [Streptomyces sp. PKU-MA01144]|uniref:S1C family serine protease n=1 Tax=Streptomyces sp. PKU-MA01144 TaxID=2729138 RepID=UPI00147DD80C|nr:trypsin-like peptidase domain-containing protein [Streptomyces sp. PKU-MA01144]NNJ03024.1 PDZ domain-containing protein [Streptomyces sp. PKU-MA01144]
MSTENEGTPAHAGPSVPPVPAAAPESAAAHPPAGSESPTQPGRAMPPAPPVPPAAHGPAPGDHSPASPASPAGYPQGAWLPPPPPASPWGGHASAPQGPRKRSGGLIASVLVAALVAGGVGGGVGYWAAERNDGGASTTVAAGDAPSGFKREPGTVAAVAGKALPSVVTIEAASGRGQGEAGTGTGFVYDKEGHILTNNHVVASAADGGTLSATFSDGKEYEAEVVGRAQGYDVAVLKLRDAPAGLTPLPLGNSDQVAVGDSTIAIGAPFGLSNTVTTGIISAKNRPVASGDGSGGRNSYMSALQTDASINPGNSGGPLLDARGAVIGINSAIQSAGGGNGFGQQSQAGSIGLGFAIPINQAKNVAEQLISTGKPVYPVIGATVNMTDRGAGATIAQEGAGGAAAVTPNGPAAKAGLRAGDVITEFDGKPIDSGPTLISEIWTHKPGDKVQLTYERDGREATVTVTLGQREGDG